MPQLGQNKLTRRFGQRFCGRENTEIELKILEKGQFWTLFDIQKCQGESIYQKSQEGNLKTIRRLLYSQAYSKP